MFVSNCIWFWWIVTKIRLMVAKIRWIVIKIRSKFVKLPQISMNGHQNQKQLVKTITSKHYFKLIPIFCQIVSGFDEWSLKLESNWSKHLPPNTIWHSFLCYIIFPKCSAKSNNLKTLFHTHSYILYNRIRVHQNPITSIHYLTHSKKLHAKPS